MTPVCLLFVDDQLLPGSPERESLLRKCAVREVDLNGSAASASGAAMERLAAFSSGEDGTGAYTYETIRSAVQAGPGPEGWSLVLLDVSFGRDKHFGETVRRRLLVEYPHLPVVLLTSHRQGELESDEAPYLSKAPLNASGLNRALLEHGRLTNKQSRALLNLQDEVVASPALLDVFRQAMRVAATEARILLLGETGVGKEVVARYIHRLSARREMRFEGENMAVVGAADRALLTATLFGQRKGFPSKGDLEMEGLFGRAKRGTLFLDEVAELPAETQGSLLRVLQENRYRRLGDEHETEADVRLLTATSRNLDDLIRSGAFRDDLYHRIAKVTLRIPPLRERPEDVRPLAEHLLRSKQDEFRLSGVEFSEAALRALETHPFPGNVRELESIVERLLLDKGSNALIAERDVRKAAGPAQSIVTVRLTPDPDPPLFPLPASLTLASFPEQMAALPVSPNDEEGMRGSITRLDEAVAALKKRLAGAALRRHWNSRTDAPNQAEAVRLLMGDPTLKGAVTPRKLRSILGVPQHNGEVTEEEIGALLEAWRSGPGGPSSNGRQEERS